MQSTAEIFVSIGTAAPEPCPVCETNQWHVLKTTPRQGKTLDHGQFETRETVFFCAEGCRHPSGAVVTSRSCELHDRLLPDSIVGYDVMVFIGRRRFLDHQQREAIRTELFEHHGVQLSTGEVSALAQRFTDYMVRLHYARADALRAELLKDGGWPMHVDATGEHGRGTLFVVLAGWRKWALGAWKPATENAELLLPCLRETVQRFGAPCAAVRDLGRAVTPALEVLVKELGGNIPVLACHQHFLADVGRDILEPSHNELRELFQRMKVRPNLRDLVRELGRMLGERIEEARDAVHAWQSLANAEQHIPSGFNGLAVIRAMGQWALDYPADAIGADFPFGRPYLDLYDRSLVALRAVDAFIRTSPTDRKVVGYLRRLYRHLAPVASEVPFSHVARRLRHRAVLFDELRDVLRLAGQPSERETPHDLEQMQSRLTAWVTLLRKRRPERGPAQDTRQAIDIILKHIEVHGNNLWGHAIPMPDNIGGGVRLVERTNILIEGFFKRLKHGERQRSGRKNLTQDLEHLPAAAALVYNLKREDYVRIVCGSIENLPMAFAQLDRAEQNSRNMRIIPEEQQPNIAKVLQIATASLSTPDRRVVRTKEMNHKMHATAASNAQRLAI